MSLDQVQHCPKAMTDLDDTDGVTVSGWLDGLDAEEEAQGLTGDDITSTPELMEAQAAKQGENKMPLHWSKRLNYRMGKCDNNCNSF